MEVYVSDSCSPERPGSLRKNCSKPSRRELSGYWSSAWAPIRLARTSICGWEGGKSGAAKRIVARFRGPAVMDRSNIICIRCSIVRGAMTETPMPVAPRVRPISAAQPETTYMTSRSAVYSRYPRAGTSPQVVMFRFLQERPAARGQSACARMAAEQQNQARVPQPRTLTDMLIHFWACPTVSPHVPMVEAL